MSAPSSAENRHRSRHAASAALELPRVSPPSPDPTVASVGHLMLARLPSALKSLSRLIHGGPTVGEFIFAMPAYVVIGAVLIVARRPSGIELAWKMALL